MIKRVHIKGYKSLRDVEVQFPGNLCVIVGPNAAGKSNLLDALGLVSSLALAPTLEEAFREHRGRIIEAFSFDEEGLRGALQKPSLRFSIEIDVELSPRVITETEDEISRRRKAFDSAKEESPRVTEKLLRYRLEIEYRPQDNALGVVDERLEALKKSGSEPKESRSAFISRESKGESPNVFRVRMEGQGARPMEFETGLPYTILSRSHYAPHYPHLEAMKRELAGWRFYYFEPREMRADNDLKVTSVPTRFGGDLASFFHNLERRDPAQYDATKRALGLILPSIQDLRVERGDDGLLRLFIKDRGTEYSARVMSEGTLRVLGLLAILQPATPATVVGFEEPENGVHPNRIRAMARVLENVGEAHAFQLIVNTHSPLLAENLPHDCLLLCRRGDSGTEFSSLASHEPLYQPSAITEALDAPEDTPTSLQERIVRGDFGA